MSSPELASTRSRTLLERSFSVLSPLALLGLWELASRADWIDARFFPAPTVILRTGWAMVGTGELQRDVSVTVVRIVIGFTLGALPGVVIGLVMGLSSIVRAVLQPLVDATFPVPKIAVLPLIILIFGIGEASKYVIIAIAVVYLVLINTVVGVRNIDSIYLDVGRSYRASRLMMFTDVALPGALPMIVAGLRLGMGVALLVIVSAEFVGADSGIGHLVWLSWQQFQVEKMYVGLLMTAVLGIGSALLIQAVEYVLVPWKR